MFYDDSLALPKGFKTSLMVMTKRVKATFSEKNLN